MIFILPLFLIIAHLAGTSQDVLKAPFTLLGPIGAPIYYDMKTALRDAGQCYKLDLRKSVIDTAKQFSRIHELKNLQVFALEANGLDRLPNKFSELNSLLYLSSVNNPLKSLPKDFGSLYSLMYLDLHNTHLDSLPTELGYLGKLKMLHLQNNITDTLEVATSIGHLPNLNDLLIYNCILDTLPADIRNLKSLKKLTLVKCGIQDIPKEIGKMPAPFVRTTIRLFVGERPVITGTRSAGTTTLKLCVALSEGTPESVTITTTGFVVPLCPAAGVQSSTALVELTVIPFGPDKRE